MKYIFIHAQKDMITEKNDGMKNSKEKGNKERRNGVFESL